MENSEEEEKACVPSHWQAHSDEPYFVHFKCQLCFNFKVFYSYLLHGMASVHTENTAHLLAKQAHQIVVFKKMLRINLGSDCCRAIRLSFIIVLQVRILEPNFTKQTWPSLLLANYEHGLIGEISNDSLTSIATAFEVLNSSLLTWSGLNKIFFNLFIK